MPVRPPSRPPNARPKRLQHASPSALPFRLLPFPAWALGLTPTQVMALVASFGDLACLLIFPCLFALRLLPLRRAERALCWGLVGGGAVLSCLGAVMSAKGLIDKVREK